MKTYDVTVIGGGPAGLGAAIKASLTGKKVLLIERENRLGGVLKQCIHDGFGLLRFGEKLSGCEYATRFIHQIKETDVEISLSTFASKIEKTTDGFSLTLVTENGMETVQSKTLVLATGCRERTAKQVAIHGTRPAGVLTAGSAQYFINIMGQLPGKNCVILGSGDIGLIMARRLTLEGANVLGVYEAKSEPSGLMRNIYQCLVDFDIPLHLSKTVVEVHGRERLTGVTVAEVDSNLNPIKDTFEYIPCDTLILSVGLIPENELAESLGVSLDSSTKGAYCDEHYMTSVPGIFACGNALHVNDLVDYVTESGEDAGFYAAEYADSQRKDSTLIPVTFSKDFLYVVPQNITLDTIKNKNEVAFFFRTRQSKSLIHVNVFCGENLLYSHKYQSLRPPEMEKIKIDFSKLAQIEPLAPIEFTMTDENINITKEESREL